MVIKSKIKRGIRSILMMIKEEKKISIPIQTNTTELLEGKTALIIGGSGGIGMAIAESFLKNGAKVIIAGTSEEKLTESKKKLGENNVESIVIRMDDVCSFENKIEKATQLFGGCRINILVNSAGVMNKTDFWNTSELEYDRVMDINVKGTFFISQVVAKYMIKNDIKGHILNVSSSSALRPAWTPYQMSKWCVRGFTIGLADTLIDHGIVVNAIGPGPVATNMLGMKQDSNIDNPKSPIKRYASPSEIANLATFMVSDMGNMVVGDTFYITGGAGILPDRM